MEDKITVHIADDHQILIDGVKAVLNLEPKIEVTGFSLNGSEVVEWFKDNQADVLVLDINMPELDGIGFRTLIHTISTIPAFIRIIDGRDLILPEPEYVLRAHIVTGAATMTEVLINNGCHGFTPFYFYFITIS